jgi:hypothetical protein
MCSIWGVQDALCRAYSSTAELAAHNRLVPGSNPGGPIVLIPTASARTFLRFGQNVSMIRMLIFTEVEGVEALISLQIWPVNVTVPPV